MTVEIIHPFIPDYNPCVVCGKETKAETCSDRCMNKLSKLREAIRLRKSVEAMGDHRDENPLKQQRAFNRIQDYIGK